MLAAGGTPDLTDKNLRWRFTEIARQDDKRAARKVKHPAATVVLYRHPIVAFWEFDILHRDSHLSACPSEAVRGMAAQLRAMGWLW